MLRPKYTLSTDVMTSRHQSLYTTHKSLVHT